MSCFHCNLEGPKSYLLSLDFSVTYSFWPHHGPGVDSTPSENEYQEHFLQVKAAGVWGWQPHNLHVPNVMEIWEPKTPWTFCVTPGLLGDCFTFFFKSCLWEEDALDFCVWRCQLKHILSLCDSVFQRRYIGKRVWFQNDDMCICCPYVYLLYLMCICCPYVYLLYLMCICCILCVFVVLMCICCPYVY